MQSAAEELELSKQVWRDVIQHLERKITAKGRGEDLDDCIDADGDEHDASIEELQRGITIYRMCIDWARDQQDLLAGRFSEPHAMQRQRFYKLMAVLAKAELERDDHVRSVAFVSSASAEHPTRQQSVNQLESAAEAALLTLVSAA